MASWQTADTMAGYGWASEKVAVSSLVDQNIRNNSAWDKEIGQDEVAWRKHLKEKKNISQIRAVKHVPMELHFASH